MKAKLYICATPIGNLGDITLRVVETLRSVEAVYAEDTRRTGALLSHLGIKKPLVSCHEHNEAKRAEEMLARVNAGEAIAFCSDAGMPCISDPGERIVRAFIEAGSDFEVLPGASAAETALIMSGLPSAGYCFYGFLPRGAGEKRSAIAKLSRHGGTLIFYESPLRVHDTLSELYAVLGERRAAVLRELTKLHEEAVRGSLSELVQRYAETPPRGECAIAVAGAQGGDQESGEDARALIQRLMESGMSAKDAAKQAAAVTDIPRSEAYKIATELKNE